MLEKLIFLGSAETGIRRDTDESWYRINYLDADTGIAVQDYVSKDTFLDIKNANLPIGSKVVGFFTIGQRRNVVLNGIKLK